MVIVVVIAITVMVTVMVIAGIAGMFTASRDTQSHQDQRSGHRDCLAHRLSP
jgi:hypothetical protein